MLNGAKTSRERSLRALARGGERFRQQTRIHSTQKDETRYGVYALDTISEEILYILY